MALVTNYATLVTAIEDYLARADLTTWVPNFLQNAEQRLYRTLRIRSMESALSGTIASGVLALDSDFLELKYAYVNRTPVQLLERVAPQEIYGRWPTRSGGAVPTHIAVDGTNYIFGPYPGAFDIAGVYYARPALLSGSNTTNWFSDNCPDLLLYGALLEAESFIKNDPRIMVWKDFYAQALESVKEEESVQRGGPLRTRAM
jgi:hypothetical protein